MSGPLDGFEGWLTQEADNFIEQWPIPGLDALPARDRHAIWTVIQRYGLAPTFDTINLFVRIITDPVGVLREELHRIFDPPLRFVGGLIQLEQAIAATVHQSATDAQTTLTAIFAGSSPLHTKPTEYIAANYTQPQHQISLSFGGLMTNATTSQSHWITAIEDFIVAVIAFATANELLIRLLPQ